MIDWEKTKEIFGYDRNLIKQKMKIVVICDECGSEHHLGWAKHRESKLNDYNCKSCRTKKSWQNEKTKEKRSSAISKSLSKQSGKMSERSKKLWESKEYKEKVSKSVKENIGEIVEQRWKDGVYKNANWNRNKRSKEAKERWEDKEYRSKMKQIMQTEEYKEKQRQKHQVYPRSIDIRGNKLSSERSKHRRKLTRSTKAFINYLVNGIRIGKRKSEIDVEFILKLWRKQQGKCALSGLEMKIEFNNLKAVSIDRIDSTKDYTQDNVQLICNFLNMAKKNESNESIKKVIELLRSNKSITQNRYDKSSIIKFIRYTLCPKYHIDYDYIFQLWNNQNGLCAISKLPMMIKSSHCALSIDRIDNAYDHNNNNIQLVCRFINLGKRHYSNQSVIDFIEELKKEPISIIDFTFSDLTISTINFQDANNFLSLYHYLQGSDGRGGTYYGAFFGDKLIAVCIFSPPSRQGTIERLNCENNEVLDLARFCIHPSYQKKNLASWFISKCIKLIKKDNPELKFLVSFADSSQGHVGIIYKATNWKEDGQTNVSYRYSDGNKMFNKYTIWKKAKKEKLSESDYVDKYKLTKIIEGRKYRFLWKY